MSNNMCPACGLRALASQITYIRAEVHRWQREEQRMLGEIRAAEERMEEEFAGLGYEAEPD